MVHFLYLAPKKSWSALIRLQNRSLFKFGPEKTWFLKIKLHNGSLFNRAPNFRLALPNVDFTMDHYKIWPKTKLVFKHCTSQCFEFRSKTNLVYKYLTAQWVTFQFGTNMVL